MDSVRVGEVDWIGENELQANKIEVDVVEEGQGRRQIPLRHRRNTNPHSLEKASEEPWQGV